MEYPALIEKYELTEENICQEISDSHLADISQSCCEKWRLLPAHLAMKAISVPDIERECKSEEERRLGFFTLWKHRKGAAATYRALITALLKSDYRQDAEAVCKLLKESLSGTNPTEKTVATTDEAHTPNISLKPDANTLEDLEQQLECNLLQITRHYASYVSAIRKHLKKEGITASELCAYLMLMPAFSTDNNKKKPALLSEAREELEKADTIDKIFIILSDKYSSFLDYEIFQALLDEYGSNDRIEKLDYPTHLKDYVNRHKIKEFAQINPLIKKLNKPSKEVVLKIDIELTCRLAKLTDLKKFLCKSLGLKAAALRIIDVKEGCVELTLLMPAHLADFIFTSDEIFTTQQIQQFKALSVEWLKCNGQIFYFSMVTESSSKTEDTISPGSPAPSQDSDTDYDINSDCDIAPEEPTTGDYIQDKVTAFAGLNAVPEQRNVPVKREITIVLIGKSGAGKSTLLKNVFGVELDVRMSALEKTTEDKAFKIKKNDITINIVDTLGFVKYKREKHLKNLSEHVPGEVDLLLYCLSITPGSRFDDWNPDLMKSMQYALGKDIWRHCMVVLTFSNLAWNHLKHQENETGENNHEAAITLYKRYIAEYTDRFRQELDKLKVKNIRVVSALDTDFDPNTVGAGDMKTIVVVPAGYRPTDEVLAGLRYTIQPSQVLKNAIDFTIHSVPAAKRDLQTNRDRWKTILVFLILQKCAPECSLGLLQFWYEQQSKRKA